MSLEIPVYCKTKKHFLSYFLKNDIERYLKNSDHNRIKNCPTL